MYFLRVISKIGVKFELKKIVLNSETKYDRNPTVLKLVFNRWNSLV